MKAKANFGASSVRRFPVVSGALVPAIGPGYSPPVQNEPREYEGDWESGSGLRIMDHMTTPTRKFWTGEAGQTLSEYSLLLAFLLIAVIGLSINFQTSIEGVAAATNNNLTAASTVVN